MTLAEFWHERLNMTKSILDYFSKVCSKAILPDPRGPFSKLLPSTIAAAKNEVMRFMNGPSAASKIDQVWQGKKRSVQ